VVVEVDAGPLDSTARFVLPAAGAGDRIARLARGLASGSRTQYDAATRILGWVARHIEYSPDRGASQRAEDVLARRLGYCTGVARLTVALLRAVGLQAREVAGWVIDDAVAGTGYHRWVEVFFNDRGWVFSDPLSTHHFVPATYVRLASDELRLDDGLEGLLLERDDRLASVDLYPSAGPGIQARRNSPRRLAAAVRVEVEGSSSGLAMLVGNTALHRKALVDGETTFVGLEPGRYRLRLFLPGRDVIERLLNLPDRRHCAVLWTPAGRP